MEYLITKNDGPELPQEDNDMKKGYSATPMYRRNWGNPANRTSVLERTWRNQTRDD